MANAIMDNLQNMNVSELIDYKSGIGETYFPLSWIQYEMWSIAQLFPDSTAYNTTFSFQIQSPVNIRALREFFQLFINKHEITRTRIYCKDGSPCQTIIPQDIYFVVRDVDAWSRDEILSAAREFYQQPFDLEQDALFRVMCFVQSTSSVIIATNIHHIIADAWSVSLLLDELDLLYPQLVKGVPVVIENLKHQYRDFVQWQRQFVESESGQEQFLYWQRFLSEKLPKFRISPKSQSLQTRLLGKTHFFTMHSVLAEQIKVLCKDQGTTLNSFFQTVLHVLLHRYSGSDTIITASPRYSRMRTTYGLKRADYLDNWGCFVNTVLNKTENTSGSTFADFLLLTHNRNNLVKKHQDYPFSLLKKQLKLNHPQINFVYQKRGTGTKDLSMFLFDTKTGLSMPVGGLTLQPFYFPQQEGQFEIVFEVMESDDMIFCNIKYQTDLYDADFIQRMEGHLRKIIEVVLHNPEININELDILTPAERQQILYDFNDTYVPYPKDKLITQLFEERVTTVPEKIAIVYEDQQLTYRELSNKSSQLSRILQDYGVKPGVVVGIMVDKSLEMIIGILAILKAGGAYLPLDPILPEERIKYMLEDSQSNILLTQDSHKHMQFSHFLKLFFIDREDLYVGAKFPLNQNNNLSDVAYIIYTSGSTGRPKGVQVQHQALLNLCHWHNNEFIITEQDRATQFAGFSFDACVWEIFPYLITGATLYILTKSVAHDIEKLNHYFIKNNITVAFLPTNYCEQFIAEKRDSSLRILLTGGDKLNRIKSQKYRIINNYGPTENAVVTTSFDVKSEYYRNIPIGKPIANTKIYILSKENLPQPIGVPGELCISGESLAMGYVNNIGLTTNKFVVNPFISDEKLYKTADLARWLPDGNVEFLGRYDNQVKVRGYRIEIGEIESTILSSPNIKETAVVVRGNDLNKFLIAFFVYYDKNNKNIYDLRRYLQERLPTYMIPTAFVELDILPLNPNGKIDYHTLAEYDFDNLKSKDFCIKPTTDVEIAIFSIWEQLLNSSKISITDDFFDVGGNSLLIIQLLIEVNKKFGISTGIEMLLTNTTIIKQAIAIDSLLQGRNCVPDKVDLIKEVSLSKPIYPHRARNTNICTPKQASAIFITGATGFLGTYLLAGLLESTKSSILGLVRAKNEVDGFHRIKEKLYSINKWKQSYEKRIIPVVGDLSQPKLGISDTKWSELEHKVDIVYHNGAMVNFIYSYEMLKPANVNGTKDIINLCCSTKLKPLYYVSTLSVFDSLTFGQEDAFEIKGIDHSEGIFGGYAQSKWVAEKLIWEASAQGLPVTVFRPGRITGECSGLYVAADELFSRLIKGFIQLNSVPDLDIRFDLFPVEVMSHLIMLISNHPVAGKEIFHLINPDKFTMRNLKDWLNEGGYPIQTLPYPEWCALLTTTQDKNNALLPFLPLFIKPVYNNLSLAELFVKSSKLRFDYSNVEPFLVENTKEKMNNKILFLKYLEFFKKIKFIPEPICNKFAQEKS